MDIILEAGIVIAEANNHQSQVILTGLDGVSQRYALFKDGLREGSEEIENLEFCKKVLQKQKNGVCTTVD